MTRLGTEGRAKKQFGVRRYSNRLHSLVPFAFDNAPEKAEDYGHNYLYALASGSSVIPLLGGIEAQKRDYTMGFALIEVNLDCRLHHGFGAAC